MTTVCLCGSARFEAQFKEASKQLGLLGMVVIGLSSYPSENDGDKTWYGPDEKEILDLVHLEKIRMADCILVIDDADPMGLHRRAGPTGYVGFSTAREILWAEMQDRPIFCRSQMTGWGNLAESINHRYDKSWQSDDAVYKARETLRIVDGKAQVTEMVHDTAKSIMHAGLSIFACQPGKIGQFGNDILVAANLDPMDDVMTALAGVMPIPSWTAPSDEFIEADETPTPFISIPVEKWNMMVGAIGEISVILAEKGGRKIARESLLRLGDVMSNYSAD
jgi:hypothetical protein